MAAGWRLATPTWARLIAKIYQVDPLVCTRCWNLRLWRRLSPAQLERVRVHPSRGEERLAVSLRALAGHTLSLLAQIEKLVG